jgi:hypothetical protein
MVIAQNDGVVRTLLQHSSSFYSSSSFLEMRDVINGGDGGDNIHNRVVCKGLDRGPIVLLSAICVILVKQPNFHCDFPWNSLRFALITE